MADIDVESPRISNHEDVEEEEGTTAPPPPPLMLMSEPAADTDEAADQVANDNNEADEQLPVGEVPSAEAEAPTEPEVEALEEGPPRVEFSAPACQTESVTIYLDRAEVRRILRLRSRAGETEVVVRDLTAAIDKESIRVEVKGAATISDVAYAATPGEADEATRAAGKAEAVAALELERRGREAVTGRLDRALKQREVLASYADALAKQPQPADSSSPYDPRRVATLGGFFDLYESRAARLDEEAAQAGEQLQLHDDAIGRLEQRMRDIDGEFGELLHREVRIYVESRQAADLELQLSYVVARARWSPRYDIRVHSNESIMRIVYHGMVQQSTGEDWTDARLVLATCQPGVGGTAPVPAMQKAHFYRFAVGKGQPQQQSQNSRLAAKKCKLPPQPDAPATVAAAAESTEAADEAPSASENQRVQSTQLEVPHRVSIPSNADWHKVMVAAIDLNPTFEHECVPQKSPFAYLKATVTNTSTYALLPGPSNIFVDGCFVAKSELKAAAPSEEFQCHLGADHGIRVAYRPVFRKRETGQAKLATVSHRQAIELQNCHRKPVRLLVMEPLPIAGEDKMKVNLVEPVIKHPEKYDRQKPVRLSKFNCVEWDLDLAAGESKELVMRYNIDLPPGEMLDYTVVCD